MSKKLMLGIIVLLLVTNIATLFVWNQEEVDIETGNGKKYKNNEAAATVNGEEISIEEWRKALRDTYGEEHLKAMIDREIVSQLANERDISISDKVIEREISLLLAMQGVLIESEYEDLEAKWEKDIRHRYQLERLLTEDVSVSDDTMKEHYETYGEQYNFTASMQLSHIIVKEMKTAEKVYNELEQGASFNLLAQEYSVDEETRAVGGYLGYLSTESQYFPDSYEVIVNNLQEFSYSEPFEVGGEVALIYLHRKLPSITFTYEEMKPYIMSELALQEKKQTLEADPLWESQDIEWIYSE
ncbi:peptidylprolyl isomerase [Virgibacillus sp.]|uniref:peptidylprolyl isomerase n=1 Tax=Virgibacillus sp. TaxID=1872700 RepID=UPI0017BCC194|nr:peptidylprolyl isomerase [Virgibacillus sp.]NWO12891.1 peptidylprolyl isomerase [Virgibacillus sp.]